MAGGPPPNQIPLPAAAGAAKGADPISRWTKALNLLVMVIAPLTVPAVILWITRGRWTGLGLLDLSFGFVALAIATLTKAITNKEEDWLTVAVGGVLGSLFFVSVASNTDHTNEINDLVSLAGFQNASFVRDRADSIFSRAAWILNHQPTVVHWAVVCALGLLLTAATTTLIVRER